MSTEWFRSRLGTGAAALLTLTLAAGLLRAQTTKFDQARNELYKQSQTQQKQLGLSNNRTKLFADYPCPEIALFKPIDLAPGGAAPLTVTGKFRPNTTFLADHDGATLSGTATASTYTGRLSIAASQLPGFVHLYAFTPVSAGYAFVPVGFINTAYAFDLRAPNGWTIKATPTAKAFTVTEREATLPYRVEFFRQNESKPFEAMQSRLRYSGGAPATTEISLDLEVVASGAQAEMQELTKKMSDMQAFLKLSEKEQNALIDRMGQLQEQMLKEMTAAVSDPAAMQKKQDDFGCRSVRVRPAPGGGISGTLSCGRNVNNGTLNVTGTMTAR